MGVCDVCHVKLEEEDLGGHRFSALCINLCVVNELRSQRQEAQVANGLMYLQITLAYMKDTGKTAPEAISFLFEPGGLGSDIANRVNETWEKHQRDKAEKLNLLLESALPESENSA